MAGGLRNALLFAPGAFAFSLGVWQVQRLEQKKSELQHREELLGGEPVDLNTKTDGGAAAQALQKHTPVTFRGRFLHDRSIFVGPRVRSELGQAFQGCMLVTPMELEGGDREGEESASRGGAWRLFGGGTNRDAPSAAPEARRTVLVLRGWVPQAWRDAPLKFAAFRSDRPVQIEGLMKPSDKPGFFAPENLPEIGQWFYYDVPAMVSLAL